MSNLKMQRVDREERALLIFEDTKNLKQLKKSLMGIDYRVFVCEINIAKITESINKIKPDLLVFYYQTVRSEVVDIVKQIQETTPTPITIFSDKSEHDIVSKAIKSGASAFVVDGIESHRIGSIIEAARARFKKCRTMKNKLSDAELKLVERDDIDRAISILMSNKKITGEEAYKLLHGMAINKNTNINEISKSLITATELLY